jgi:hypothetical protein
MRLRFIKNSLTYAILILCVFVPMLDGMVCADCIGNDPFQGETTISHLQSLHDDVRYSSKDGAPSKTASTQDAESFCSICANDLMGVEILSPDIHIPVAQCDVPCAEPTLSELHYPINKPPQNLLV